MVAPPVDAYQRKIDYLRLSITDRCNLRCVYCMPPEGLPLLNHAGILTYEEILRLVGVAVRMGISKIRITGGEPLVRRNVVYLCERIAALEGVSSFSLTTNGVLLQQYAAALRKAGVERVNISLDTLRPERFQAITRLGRFDRVWRGIETAREAGFAPIKLNVVVMRGVNDDEIEDMAMLTMKYPYHVRFIELMPFSADVFQDRFFSSEETLERISGLGPLSPCESRNSNGPARYFQLEGASGKIGVISPISRHFCPGCNRLRVTADGKLRTCLFSNEETDLFSLLRQKVSGEELVRVIRQAIASKPEKHRLSPGLPRKCVGRPMARIGG